MTRSLGRAARLLALATALVTAGMVAGCDKADDQPGPLQPSASGSAPAGGAGPLQTGSPPASIGPDDPSLAAGCAGRPTAVGVAGTSRSLLISTRVCTAAQGGGEYWLIARSSENLYYPKYALAAGVARTSRTLVLGAGVESGSSRTFFVAAVPSAAVAWMRDAFQNDGAGAGWPGDRSKLPAGVTTVSNEVVSTITS